MPTLPAMCGAALEEIEQLISRIETGQGPLEQMPAGYEGGAQMLALCRSRLGGRREPDQGPRRGATTPDAPPNTGALLHASVALGAARGEAAVAARQALDRYGRALELTFQGVDDILDVTADSATLGMTAGADTANDKPTYVSLLGLYRSRTYAADLHALPRRKLPQLADELHSFVLESVARTPARESLERLFQEGYVTRILNRGYYVAEINEQEVCDLYRTREALESFALRLTLERGVTARELKPVQATNASYAELCHEGLTHERVMIDREFHLRLASLSRNSYLVRTLEGIFDRIIHKRRVEGYHDTRGLTPYRDHMRLLEAVMRRDADGAQAIMHDHIDSACTRLLHFLREGEGQSR